jgi:hypothetical protein
MIRDFDTMIVDLGGQIAAEEDRTKIKDTSHPAYSTLAMAVALPYAPGGHTRLGEERRENLLISVAHIKSMLDVAKRELDEIRAQLLDLELDHDNQPSRMIVAISAAE